MTQNLEVYLTTCQVGITASSIAVGIVAEPAPASLFEPVFAATPLYWFHRLISPIITLGDWIAKATLKLFGIEMTGAWLETDSDYCGYFHRGYRKIPFQRLSARLWVALAVKTRSNHYETDAIESRAQLRNRIDSLLDEGEIPEERQKEVLSALDVGTLPIREVMNPAAGIVALSTTNSPEENLDRIRHTPHTRFPLVGEKPTEFHGIVYAPSIIDHFEELRREEINFTDIAAPPMTLAAGTSVSDAFDQFQAEDQELALVLEDPLD